MSSALAKFSQIPVRSKFLIVLSSTQVGQLDASGGAAFSLDEGEQWGVGTVGTIMTGAALDAVASGEALTVGQLYRDLGRQIMVVHATTGAHQALFREAIRQNSAANEGVNYATPSIWICVWRADGSNVAVARTG